MAAPTGSLKRRVPVAGILATRPHITRLLIHLGRYHALALQIRTDRTENHVAAVALNVTWQRVKRLFARKGIVL
jgi:hypothetical protein